MTNIKIIEGKEREKLNFRDALKRSGVYRSTSSGNLFLISTDKTAIGIDPSGSKIFNPTSGLNIMVERLDASITINIS